MHDFSKNVRDTNEPTRDASQDNAQPLSFGQKLVGLNFNPSNDDKVSKAKQLCADLADLLYEDNAKSENRQWARFTSPVRQELIRQYHDKIDDPIVTGTSECRKCHKIFHPPLF